MSEFVLAASKNDGNASTEMHHLKNLHIVQSRHYSNIESRIAWILHYNEFAAIQMPIVDDSNSLLFLNVDVHVPIWSWCLQPPLHHSNVTFAALILLQQLKTACPESWCLQPPRHHSVTFAALILLQRLKRLKVHSSLCYFCCSCFAPATQATQSALITLLPLLLSFCSSDSSDSRHARHSVTLAALVLLQQLKSALILCRLLVMSRLYGPGKYGGEGSHFCFHHAYHNVD
ncbi:hypothetical protein F4604DRAFT_1687312 [Suillus subluteus]|nr:hypothetical protein F4604DRAFT_1687312 [Suillus subluteus]